MLHQSDVHLLYRTLLSLLFRQLPLLMLLLEVLQLQNLLVMNGLIENDTDVLKSPESGFF